MPFRAYLPVATTVLSHEQLVVTTSVKGLLQVPPWKLSCPGTRLQHGRRPQIETLVLSSVTNLAARGSYHGFLGGAKMS